MRREKSMWNVSSNWLEYFLRWRHFMHDCPLFDSSLANHKLSYISKYISVTYALDSVHEKIDVWTEAGLLLFYPTIPVG